MIETIARGLKNKLKEVVFVGGSVMELYVDDPAVQKPRVTDDVDVVAEIISRARYDEFEKELRELGFINDTSGPACRLIFKGVKLDIITTGQSGSGFTNRWYETGFRKSISVNAGISRIKIFPAEYFIASKFEAFKNRGKNDLLASHDLEDIIYVFDGRSNIENEIVNSETDIRSYLNNEIKLLLKNPQISEIINGHLGQNVFQERADRIIKIFNNISI